MPKDTKGTPSLPKDKAKKTDKMSKKAKDAPKKKWKITPKKVVALVCGIICLVALIGFIVYSFTKENPPRYNEKYVYDGNSLVGTWREYEFDESFFQIYEFTRDKKVILKSYTYGIFDQELVGSYETSNTNTITISYSDKEKEQSSFSIDEGGRLVIYTLGEMGFEETIKSQIPCLAPGCPPQIIKRNLSFSRIIPELQETLRIQAFWTTLGLHSRIIKCICFT